MGTFQLAHPNGHFPMGIFQWALPYSQTSVDNLSNLTGSVGNPNGSPHKTTRLGSAHQHHGYLHTCCSSAKGPAKEIRAHVGSCPSQRLSEEVRQGVGVCPSKRLPHQVCPCISGGPG